jgi:tetratricopeptide (TPR) repeat protein
MSIKAGFVLVFMMLAMLCSQSLAQTTVQDWIDKGGECFTQGKYNDSLQAFENAINLDPENSEAWYNKGVVLFYKGIFNESLQAFNKAIEINPLDADAWYNKGSALTKLGKTTAAKEAFERASELEEFIKANEPRSGNQDATRPTESIPKDIETETAKDWLNKGNSLYNQGKYEDAIHAYDRALELDPLDPEVWQNKGYALNKLGKNKEANECFWKATGLKAGYASDRKQWFVDGKSNKGILKGTTMDYALRHAQSKTSSDTVSLNPRA